METPWNPHVAVVGAGITGLSFAYHLLELGRSRSLPIRVTVFEARNRPGGVISTVKRDGFILEEGPDAFITDKPWGRELCVNLGLSDELIGTNPDHRSSFVLMGGTLHPVPEGLYLMAPSKIWPVVRSKLLSWPAKARMAMELFVPRRMGVADESVASFVRRRFGPEVFERLAQPMVGGIYAADAEVLSMQATLPRFVEMEQKHGSITRALWRARSEAAGAGGAGMNHGVSGPRYSLFQTLRGGMSGLVSALTQALPEGSIRVDSDVAELERRTDGTWEIGAAGERVQADAVCLCVGPRRSADLIRQTNAVLSDELAALRAGSSMTVNLAYHEEQFGRRLVGSGMVIPSTEKTAVVGVSFSSLKFEGRTPARRVLLRAFLGGPNLAENEGYSDTELAATVHSRIRRALDIIGDPLFFHVARHPQAMPHYKVGHLETMGRIDTLCARLPGLFLAGNAFRGIGVPDRVRDGQLQSEACMERLQSRHAAR